MKLFIPLICYNHGCHTSYMMSMLKFILFCRENGISCTVYPITFESLISRARNAAVAHFLSDADATHLLFIDSDIEFEAKDVIALLQSDKDVVCGSYPQKWLDLSKYNSAPGSGQAVKPIHACVTHSVHLSDSKIINMSSQSTSLPVKYATTGFLLVKRGVFEAMMKAYPERQYRNDIDGYMGGANALFFYDFFPVTIEPVSRRYESEDYGFSRLWTSIGGDIFVIPDITLRHYGWFAYEGNLHNTLSMKTL